MANSTACSFNTGSEPGNPKQVGQMLTFGSSPNALRQPQNSFVAVCSSQCTSSPMTIFQSELMEPRLPRPGPPGTAALLATPAPAPVPPTPNGTETAGCPDRLEGMVQTSFMYIAMGSSTLAPTSNAVVGAVAPSRTSNDE